MEVPLRSCACHQRYREPDRGGIPVGHDEQFGFYGHAGITGTFQPIESSQQGNAASTNGGIDNHSGMIKLLGRDVHCARGN